jgi:hypothetical protein
MQAGVGRGGGGGGGGEGRLENTVLYVLQDALFHVSCHPRVCLSDQCEKNVTVHHVIPGAWATLIDRPVVIELWLGRFRRGHSNTHAMGYDHFVHPLMGEEYRFANPAGVQHWRREKALVAAKQLEHTQDEDGEVSMMGMQVNDSHARVIMFHSECDVEVSEWKGAG